MCDIEDISDLVIGCSVDPPKARTTHGPKDSSTDDPKDGPKEWP